MPLIFGLGALAVAGIFGLSSLFGEVKDVEQKAGPLPGIMTVAAIGVGAILLYRHFNKR